MYTPDEIKSLRQAWKDGKITLKGGWSYGDPETGQLWPAGWVAQLRGVELVRKMDQGRPYIGIQDHDDKEAFRDTHEFFGYDIRPPAGTALLYGGVYIKDLADGKTGDIIAKLESTDESTDELPAQSE